MALGKATVNILANLKPLKRGLLQAQVAVSSMVKRAGSLMKTGFTAGFRIISAGLAKITRLAKIAALALLGIGAASVKIAADTEETANLFDISMGSMADSANEWVREYSSSLGLFESNTKKAVSTFQLMLTSMGFTEKAAFDMSKGLVELTNDIASLRNLGLDEAFTKVRAGLTGEAEPLKRIGILLDETTVKQLALNDATFMAGLAAKKTKPELKKYGNLVVDVSKAAKVTSFELTQLEKVQFRYKALLAATSRDQGDFKRTIDSTTNVFKIIKEQILATGNTIGGVFIEDVTKAGKIVRDFFVNNQPMIEKWATVVKEAIGAVIDRLKIYFELAKTGPKGFETIFKDIGKIFGGLFQVLKNVFLKLRPVMIDVGNAIAEGFVNTIKGTKLGKFLETAGVATDIVTGTDRFLRESARSSRVDVAGGKISSRIGSITERATGQRTIEDRGNADVVAELKLLNKLVQGQVGDI